MNVSRDFDSRVASAVRAQNAASKPIRMASCATTVQPRSRVRARQTKNGAAMAGREQKHIGLCKV